jgi:hypothetical protein
MAKLVLTDADVMVNTVDLGAYVKSLTLRVAKDIPDATSMGSTWVTALCGAFHADGTIEFFQDYAVSIVDTTIYTAFLVVAGVVIKFAPIATATATTSKPIYYGTAHITEYTPLGGSYGEVCMAPVSFTFTGAITRDTSGSW